MIQNIYNIAAAFSTPEQIGVDPQMMLWMFPLLASIAIVYKATKLRVIFLGRFFKEAAILFGTLSVFMVILGFALHIIVKFLT